jgi:hypothetical protein
MGWGSPALINVNINNQNFSEVYEKYFLFHEFCQKSIGYLELHKLVFPDKIRKKIFFDEVGYYARFASNSFDSYEHVLEYLLNENDYLHSPIDALKLMVTVSYFSYLMPETKYYLGIGDNAVMWLDMEFEKGKAVKIQRHFDEELNMSKEEIIDEARGQAFVCSQEEIEDFFKNGVFEFLFLDKKKNNEKTQKSNLDKINLLSVDFLNEFTKDIKNKLLPGLSEYDIKKLHEALNSSGSVLDLQKIDFVSNEVAELLGIHKGTLNLNGLKVLNDKVAEELGKHHGHLQLNGLETLSEIAAANIKKTIGYLELKGLKSLSDQSAIELSSHKGMLNLSGLETISQKALKALLNHSERVWLPSNLTAKN